ncbi:magnesium-transporting ATPase (P-type) [Bacillus thuringiensis]
MSISIKRGRYLYRNLLNFSLYCILSFFIYLTIYFIAIKPAIITATSIDYNRLQFVTLLRLHILVSMVNGLIIKKLIRHNSRSSDSIANESVLFIFSHIFTALILFFIISI